MKKTEHNNITKKFQDGTPIDRAVRRAARRAVQIHKHARLPLSFWEKGRMVFISPHQIPEGTDEAY